MVVPSRERANEAVVSMTKPGGRDSASRRAVPPALAPIAALALGVSAVAAEDALDLAPQTAPDGAPVLEDVHECLIEPMTVTDVGSPGPGTVEAVDVERGQRVERGQTLATLEAGLEAAGVDYAAAGADMISEIAAREADLELADLELARIEDMHGQALVSEQSLDEARVRRRVAAAALVQALENRRLRQLELARAREQLARRTIQSPIDGVVVEQHRYPGEFVHEHPIVTVARIDPRRVEVVLPARLFGTVAGGQEARVHPELGVGSGTDQSPGALAAGALEARVDAIDAVLDAASGTFGLRLLLSNPDGTVLGGQRCRVDFGADGAPEASSDRSAYELAGEGG